MEWLQYLLSTYERCLTTFICCGWAYGAIFCPLPPIELSQIWESSEIIWLTAGLQLTPLCSGWGSNPTWNGSHISSQHMQRGWQPSYAVDGHGAIFCILPLQPLELSQIWEVFWNYGSLLGCQRHHCVVVEALTHHGMVPISPHNICKVVDKLHMLWMGIWRHILPITNNLHLSCPRFGITSEFMVHCWAAYDTIMQWLRL